MMQTTRRFWGALVLSAVHSSLGVLAVSVVVVACSASTGAPAPRGQDRIHVVNQPLAVTSAPGSTATKTQSIRPNAAKTQGNAFTYVASVDAPVDALGRRLQATNFAFDQRYAYVVYNMAGPDISGALDVVDLSDPTSPRLVASVAYDDAEFADVRIDQDRAYLVGAGHKGALLRLVDISEPSDPKVAGDLRLASYYATSIDILGGTAWVTTGSDGGVAEITVGKQAPTLARFSEIGNALSTVQVNGARMVLGGDSTALHRLDDGVFTKVGDVSSSPIPAPGRMATAYDLVFTNAGHSGLRVLKLTGNGTRLDMLASTALEGTGNGIDASQHLLVLAQGEAGTLLYDIDAPETPSLLGKFDFPDDRGSANQIRFGACGNKEYVFQSDGLGGFRIVQVND